MREAIRRIARELPAIAAVPRVDSLDVAAFRARAAATLKKPPSALQFEQIDAPLVLGFLGHLETARHNGPNSRNTRLAAPTAKATCSSS
jgi:hypothetical protein